MVAIVMALTIRKNSTTPLFYDGLDAEIRDEREIDFGSEKP